MTIKRAVEAYCPNPLDQAVPPCYVRFALVFPVSNVSLAIEYLQRWAALFESEFPIFTGCIAPVKALNAKKGALEIRPTITSEFAMLVYSE